MTCPVVIDPPSNNNIVLRGYFAPINYHGKKKIILALKAQLLNRTIKRKKTNESNEKQSNYNKIKLYIVL